MIDVMTTPLRPEQEVFVLCSGRPTHVKVYADFHPVFFAWTSLANIASNTTDYTGEGFLWARDNLSTPLEDTLLAAVALAGDAVDARSRRQLKQLGPGYFLSLDLGVLATPWGEQFEWTPGMTLPTPPGSEPPVGATVSITHGGRVLGARVEAVCELGTSRRRAFTVDAKGADAFYIADEGLTWTSRTDQKSLQALAAAASLIKP